MVPFGLGCFTFERFTNWNLNLEFETVCKKSNHYFLRREQSNKSNIQELCLTSTTSPRARIKAFMPVQPQSFGFNTRPYSRRKISEKANCATRHPGYLSNNAVILSARGRNVGDILSASKDTLYQLGPHGSVICHVFKIEIMQRLWAIKSRCCSSSDHTRIQS